MKLSRKYLETKTLTCISKNFLERIYKSKLYLISLKLSGKNLETKTLTCISIKLSINLETKMRNVEF